MRSPLSLIPSQLEPETSGTSPVRAALRLVFIYLAVAIPLALTADWVIERWVADAALRSRIQTGTEVFFILGTGALIGFLAFRELRRFKEFHEHYRTIVEQSLAGLTVVQGERFLYVNPRYAEIFGYEPEEMTEEMPVADVIAPEDRETVAENLRQRLEGETEDVHYRYTGLRKDGETVRIEVYGRRIEWEGEPAVTSIHLDVTEEESLREQARRAQRMEALGELTGAVAHDFNNILTAIITPLDLCEDELGADHPAREELEEAKQSAKRAVMLTRQLLSFSRRRIYKPRLIDMGELVRRTAPMLDRLIDAGVVLHLELADDLPTVEIDPAHFEQVLLNLVTNAADAVAGPGDVWIRVRSADPRRGTISYLVLEVSDNGRGMDEETRRRIFEPFFTTREEGTGLGLSTVHGIVKQIGGEIAADSAVGEGTTFRIRLPGIDKAAEPLGEEDRRREKKRGVQSNGASVLIVDDEDAVRRVTERLLERHGLAVESAPSAENAIALFERSDADFDVLLADVGLPDMDGVELASRIREQSPEIAVLYMSGHSDEEVLGRLARERSAGFVEKPFSVDEMLGAVRSALGRGGEERGTAG